MNWHVMLLFVYIITQDSDIIILSQFSHRLTNSCEQLAQDFCLKTVCDSRWTLALFLYEYVLVRFMFTLLLSLVEIMTLIKREF